MLGQTHHDVALLYNKHLISPNCTTEDQTTENIVECLRIKSPQYIVAFNSAAPPYAVIEYSENDEDTFIGERNFEELHSNSVEIPIMHGTNLQASTCILVNFRIFIIVHY